MLLFLMIFWILTDWRSSIFQALPSLAHTTFLLHQVCSTNGTVLGYPMVLGSTTPSGVHCNQHPLCRCFKSVSRSSALPESFSLGLPVKTARQKNPQQTPKSLCSNQTANRHSFYFFNLIVVDSTINMIILYPQSGGRE